ncbi:MAG: hypothetical protein L0338_03090 [Acidobacteria bacterium]|nr:hypothetical protein [Acidobacteriota bacterium]
MRILHADDDHTTTALHTLVALFLLLAVSSPAFSQQTYVSRFDLYTGYTFLDSPHIGLFQNGFHTQFGYRTRTWLTLGFDYSISTGDLTLVPSLLPTPLQRQLAAQLAARVAAGQLPPGYSLMVPATSSTQTFALGPQYTYRRFKHLTLFARPSLGAIREVATPHPRDPFAAAVAMQLAPSGKKLDWTGFYGFGGGVDVILSPHISWRTQADLVWDHLFSDLLRDGRWTVRFSVGLAFTFGRNIAGTK